MRSWLEESLGSATIQALGQCPNPVSVFDRQMRYLAVSESWLRDFPPPHDIIGADHYDVTPQMPPHWRDVHRRCLEGAIEQKEEDPFRSHTGETWWLRWQVNPWLEPDGGIGGLVIFSENVSDWKLAERNLAANNDRLAALVGRLPGLVTDPATQLERPPREARPIRLEDWINANLPQLRSLLLPHAHLVVESLCGDGWVFARPSELRSLFTNLVLLARDNVPPGSTVRLVTRTLTTSVSVDLAFTESPGPRRPHEPSFSAGPAGPELQWQLLTFMASRMLGTVEVVRRPGDDFGISLWLPRTRRPPRG